MLCFIEWIILIRNLEESSWRRQLKVCPLLLSCDVNLQVIILLVFLTSGNYSLRKYVRLHYEVFLSSVMQCRYFYSFIISETISFVSLLDFIWAESSKARRGSKESAKETKGSSEQKKTREFLDSVTELLYSKEVEFHSHLDHRQRHVKSSLMQTELN
jgi:hypothetical protein